MTDRIRFRATTVTEYTVDADAAIEAYGTDDPIEMAAIDQQQINDHDGLFVVLDSADVVHTTVEPA